MDVVVVSENVVEIEEVQKLVEESAVGLIN